MYTDNQIWKPMQIFMSSAIDNADAVKALLSNGFAFFYRPWFIVFMFA